MCMQCEVRELRGQVVGRCPDAEPEIPEGEVEWSMPSTLLPNRAGQQARREHAYRWLRLAAVQVIAAWDRVFTEGSDVDLQPAIHQLRQALKAGEEEHGR